MKTLSLMSTPADIRQEFEIRDDFCDGYVSGDRWTLVATDSGTATIGDAAGGVLTLAASDGTAADNDESYLKTTKEIFKIASEKPLEFETNITPAQGNTNALNLFAGFMEGVAANSIQDDGAGPKADFSGAGFFAIDGDTTWRVIYSDGTTQTIIELDADGSLDGVAKTVAGNQVLNVEIKPISSTKVDITFRIDGVVVAKMKDKTYASASEMNAAIGIKAGSTTAETVAVDYVIAKQRR